MNIIPVVKEKICNKCKRSLPTGREFFYADGRNKDGLQGQCKKCCNDRSTAYNDTPKGRAIHSKCQKAHRKRYVKTIMGHLVNIVGLAKQRCRNGNHLRYQYYGGRGIDVCFSTQEFYDWCTANRIDPRGKEMHRRDNDDHYHLDNIEFLTPSEHGRVHAEMRKNDIPF